MGAISEVEMDVPSQNYSEDKVGNFIFQMCPFLVTFFDLFLATPPRCRINYILTSISIAQ